MVINNTISEMEVFNTVIPKTNEQIRNILRYLRNTSEMFETITQTDDYKQYVNIISAYVKEIENGAVKQPTVDNILDTMNDIVEEDISDTKYPYVAFETIKASAQITATFLELILYVLQETSKERLSPPKIDAIPFGNGSRSKILMDDINRMLHDTYNMKEYSDNNSIPTNDIPMTFALKPVPKIIKHDLEKINRKIKDYDSVVRQYEEEKNDNANQIEHLKTLLEACERKGIKEYEDDGMAMAPTQVEADVIQNLILHLDNYQRQRGSTANTRFVTDIANILDSAEYETFTKEGRTRVIAILNDAIHILRVKIGDTANPRFVTDIANILDSAEYETFTKEGRTRVIAILNDAIHILRVKIGDTANSDVENNNNNNDNNNNSKEMLLVNELERVKEDLITTKRSEEMIKRAIEEQRNEYVKLQADYKHNLEDLGNVQKLYDEFVMSKGLSDDVAVYQRDIKGLNDRKYELEQNAIGMKNDYDELLSRYEACKTDMSNIQRERHEIQYHKQPEEYSRIMDEKNKERETLLKDLNSTKTQKEQLQRYLDECVKDAKRVGDNYEMALKEHASDDARVKMYQSQLAEVSDKRDVLEQDLTVLQKKYDDMVFRYNASVEDIDRLRTAISEKRDRSVERENNEYETRYTVLKNEREALENKLTAIMRNRDELSAEYHTCQVALADMTNEYDKVIKNKNYDNDSRITQYKNRLDELTLETEALRNLHDNKLALE